MIVRWPDKIQAGNVSTAPWYFADVMPTLAEIAGAMPVANTDGISVLPTLLGQSQVLDERFLYWEIPPPKLRQAARMGPWKAVREEPNLPLRVFNVVDDVSEENDVASVQSELVAKFENYLKNARTDSPH